MSKQDTQLEMDIESYIDNSKTVVFGGAISKTQKCKWPAINSAGTFKLIPKAHLQIDVRYQRQEVNLVKTRKIANAFDWRLFGVLAVVARPDGSLWIYDGGHRWRASSYRDEIDELPCMVFAVKSLEEEAKSFIGTNTLHKNVSASELYKAALQAKEPDALQAEAILKTYGYVVYGRDSDKPRFRGIGALRMLIKNNLALTQFVFAVCVEIVGPEGIITSKLLKAIYLLEKNSDATVMTQPNIKKLAVYGHEGLHTAMIREKHITGRGSVRVDAKAIVDILNKGKLKKNRMSITDFIGADEL